MKSINIYDPIYGLPLKLNLFDDGQFSFVHPITHRVITGQYSKYALTIPIDVFDQENQTRAITAGEASEILDISRMRVTQLCTSGKLKSAIIGSSLFVDYDDVLQYLNSDRTPGRKVNSNDI